ncbi:MAG: acetate--CoA ligase alpha subunit [Candidatus Scalinduaceae bacterium]
MDKMKQLEYAFSPKSIAVIGASTRDGTVGRSIFSNILLNKYNGIMYPVNPKSKGIIGVKCYSSIMEIPDSVDMAIIIVPRDFVPGVIKECGLKGVKVIVIISAGFKEIGGEGIILERKVKEIANRYSMSLIGPNCFGIINTSSDISLNATFSRTIPKKGNIAFISQSGALCAAILDYAKSEYIGFSKFVSMGNKADIMENDLLSMLEKDPNTDVILMYIEDLVNGREFINIARKITSRKPILAIKSGRTPQGARAASSHTGSLSGSDDVYNAIFAQCGVLRVETMEELFSYGKAFAKQPLPKGRRMAIITNAGGPGIITTDACVKYNLELPAFQKNTTKKLKAKLPPAANTNNPVDVLGDATSDRYGIALDSILKDSNIDGVIVILTPAAVTDIKEIAKVIATTSAKYDKPVLCCFMGLFDVSEGIMILEENNIPHYSFPEVTARALSNMYEYSWWTERPRTRVRKFKVNKKAVSRIINKVKNEKRSFLFEQEALSVFKAYGLPVVDSILATNEDDAAIAAERFGYPVVAKVASPDILHKFDVGGVRLDLKNKNELISSYRKIVANVKSHKPDAKIKGMTVQKMIEGGKEAIIGMNRDVQFGPLLMFGLGGIYVEAIRDVTFRLAPIRSLSAIRMIKSIRAYKILEGVRGEKPSDIDAIAKCLERISQLVIDFESILELDINPLRVFNKGKGCKVVDARIIIK